MQIGCRGLNEHESSHILSSAPVRRSHAKQQDYFWRKRYSGMTGAKKNVLTDTDTISNELTEAISHADCVVNRQGSSRL